MNDLNYILLSGNLTADPVLKTITEDSTVCRFTIAVNRKYFDKKSDKWVSYASFIPIESWGNAAFSCAQLLSKGRGIRVVGHLVQSSWKDNNNNSHEKLYIVSQHIEFQPVKKQDEVKIIVSDETDEQNEQNISQEQETQDKIKNNIKSKFSKQ